MRRPLKPFVKEYKTSGRRQQQATEPPAQKGAGAPAPERWAAPDADSSYEAAMRAADALFSGAQRSGPTPAAASSVDTAGTLPPSKPAGRILRVLDEAPSPQFAALEAAYAPKRRGRKPGSKNKPKVRPVEVAAPEAAATIAAVSPAKDLPQEPRIAPVQRRTALMPIRAGQRFSWVRDKLGPGEEWKRRRLPRICW